MVSVPITSRGSREVQPLGNDRLRYGESRNYVGRAVEGFGQAVSKAADDFDRIEATYDEADALRVANEFGSYERERLRTGENAYLTTQGFNAGEGREAAVNDLSTAAENLLGGARSDRARNMAQQALLTRMEVAETRIAEHAVGQMRVAQTEQSQARISLALTDAVDGRGTDQFDVNLGLGVMQLEQMGRNEGWGKARIDNEVFKLTENAHSQVVLAMDAEDGEPTSALAYLDANKDMLSPGVEAKLRESLKPRVLTAKFDEVVNSGALLPYVASAESVGGAAPVEGAEPAASAPVTLAIPFGGNATTVRGGRYGAPRSYGGHSGVDYAGLPAGTAVPASGVGEVISSEYRDGYGHRVEIYHGKDAQGRKITSTYSHLADRKVQVGDRVGAGATVGGVGSSGGNYGTHLHWEVMVDGKKVDPSTVSGLQITGGVGGTSAPVEGGVPADPRLNSQTMRDAAKRYAADNNLSEEETQALYASTDRAVSQGRQDRAQAEQDSDRRVLDWLTQNKPGADDLTSLGQIPAAIREGMSPSTAASLQDRIQATHSRIQSRNNAAAEAQAQALEQAAVFELYTLSDEELAGRDLRQYAGRIGLDKLGPWVDRQQRAAKAEAAGPKPVSNDRIASTIDSIGKPYGASRAPGATEDERAAWLGLRGYVERRIAGRTDDEVSKEELRGIIAAGMGEVEVKGSGWFGSQVGADTKPAALLEAGEVGIAQVPRPVKRGIEANLRARLRREPSEKEVWETYQAGKARGIYE